MVIPKKDGQKIFSSRSLNFYVALYNIIIFLPLENLFAQFQATTKFVPSEPDLKDTNVHFLYITLILSLATETFCIVLFQDIYKQVHKKRT